ncbi:MAG: ATP-dependent Clp protease adaptor ClpS [Bacteroidetes bacterium]|nr:MAG: ATP-dependent Clp protease adaptor ClpS [Bacteroidota bacterium]
MAFQTENENDLLDLLVLEDIYDLVVYNDDVNTFEHVIHSLVEICGHVPTQAEQCAMLIHYKGKCAVRRGSFDEMAKMRAGICDRGISAEVE